MITWIQLVLQKHHKVVFSILLVAITIAFVFTIGAVPFFGDSNRYNGDNSKEGLFYGFDLKNPDVAQHLYKYAWYDARLQGTYLTEALVLKQAYLRHIANTLGIKSASQKTLDSYIQDAPAFKGKNGKFDKKLFSDFLADVKANGTKEEEITKILTENAMLNSVENILVGANYVIKSEVQRQYNLVYGSWDFNLAVIPADSFKPEIKVDVAKLDTFYKENGLKYQVKEGVVLETVFLPVSKFALSVPTPSDAQLKTFYEDNKAKYTDTLEKVKDKVKADYVADISKRKAIAYAKKIGDKIRDSQVKMASPELKKIFEEEKLTVKKSIPMRLEGNKTDESLPVDVIKAGFELDETRFFNERILVDDGVWLVFLAEKLAAYQPKLEDVKASVEKDFIEAEKRRLFAEYGKKLSDAFEKGLKEGKTFASIAKANNVDVEVVKNFSIMNPTSVSDKVRFAYQVLSAELPKMKVGGLSKMQVSGANGFIVNLTGFQKPAEDAKRMAEFEKAQDNVMHYYSAQSIFSQAFSSQGEKQEK